MKLTRLTYGEATPNLSALLELRERKESGGDAFDGTLLLSG